MPKLSKLSTQHQDFQPPQQNLWVDSGSGSLPISLDGVSHLLLTNSVKVQRDELQNGIFKSFGMHGDPTLAPPSNVTWSSGVVSWSPSPDDGPDPNDVWYLLKWSSSGIGGPWMSIALTNLTAHSHLSAESGKYRVRARKLIQTGGAGAYYNLSQAAFYTIKN